MSIFLIIIGAILTLCCSLVYFGTALATKNQENWDDFMKSFEENNLSVPEETVYAMVSRMKLISGCATLIGIMCLLGGILLQIF